MYDNLDMNIKKEHCTETDFLGSIPQYLSKITSDGNSQFGRYINGYLDNLKISITEKRVKVFDSSICKYYLGDNFKTLTKGDTKKAIQKISDILHLPFDFANVTRIDFAQNIITKYPEKLYYQYLGEAQYYNRLEQNNGLYYNNQIRQLLFYGKVYEQKIKNRPIPELYKNRNSLRFELRFKKRLTKQFNRQEITAGLLYNEEFYNNLVKRWKNEYLAIQKINSKLTNMRPTGSKKQFIENLALYTILELGQPQILNKVKEWQQTKEIDKKQAFELRKSIKEISRTPIDDKGNDLINELNRKIKEAARYS